VSGQVPNSRQPSPAVAAFLRSTRWRVLIGLDILAAVASVVGYVRYGNILWLAPIVLMGGVVAFTLFRVARSAADPAASDKDPIVQ
jgi:hypothetical protein